MSIPGRPCGICARIIPPDEARISHANGDMCLSHEGKKIEVWKLTVSGASCIYRKRAEADEDIKSFKEAGDKYTFEKVKIPCMELLAMGEFVGW